MAAGRCVDVRYSDLDRAADVVARFVVSRGVYGPVDRLANAYSVEALLVGLYELLRALGRLGGVSRGEVSAVEGVVERIVRAALDEESRGCREEALLLGRMLAVRALSRALPEAAAGGGG